MKITLRAKQGLKAILAIAVMLLTNSLKTIAQTTPTPVADSLNIADASALLHADGLSFSNEVTGAPYYRVPKTGPACSIYVAGLWIGGLDGSGILHTAAQTYNQGGKVDFWPGPIMTGTNYSAHQDSLWNKVWKVNKSTIDSFRAHKYTSIPASIANWPGNGDVSLGEGATLAPYVDSSNSGYYNPSRGDYPSIRGDQTLYMIFNDDRGTSHAASGGLKLGIEVHLMAYQYNDPTDSAVNQSTFIHYDIFNRSANTYNHVYLGYYCDMDLGNGGDDYIGSDSAGDYWYTYNGEATDPNGSGSYTIEKGYGGPTPPPPAQGVAYLCDTMTHFIYYDNSATATGNPQNAAEYYGYMQSEWADGSHMTYGGTGYNSSALNTNYMFTGNPATGTAWSEVSAADAAGDRRGLSSVGPFTLGSHTDRTMDFALVFARATSGNQNTSVTKLATAIQDVRAFYATQGYVCDKTLTGVNEVKTQTATATFYPNPFSSRATLSVTSDKELTNAQLDVYDMLGRQVYSQAGIHTNSIAVEKGNMPTGLYFYRLSEEGQLLVDGKFIVQ